MREEADDGGSRSPGRKPGRSRQLPICLRPVSNRLCLHFPAQLLLKMCAYNVRRRERIARRAQTRVKSGVVEAK